MLRETIEAAIEADGGCMKDYTVLKQERDRYRLDTPANHRDGRWFRDAYMEVHGSTNAKRIHLRGLFYKLLGRVERPDGTPFINDDKTWEWLSEKAAKASRYLGYTPWDAIRDARNSPPQIFTPEYDAPHWSLQAAEVELYLPDDLKPVFTLNGDLYRQPYRQVVLGEKAGIEDPLLAVCKRRRATLAIPSGEVSDSMLYDLLKDADDDGRPLVLHQLADADPAGHQMAISTTRTIQALVSTRFPDLRVIVHAVALTREQCVEWDLPNTPLKETELRADRWMAAMGRGQTELDSAIALVPDEFAQVVEDSLLQYYDTSIARRAAEAKRELEREANTRLCRVPWHRRPEGPEGRGRREDSPTGGPDRRSQRGPGCRPRGSGHRGTGPPRCNDRRRRADGCPLGRYGGGLGRAVEAVDRQKALPVNPAPRRPRTGATPLRGFLCVLNTRPYSHHSIRIE